MGSVMVKEAKTHILAYKVCGSIPEGSKQDIFGVGGIRSMMQAGNNYL